MPFVCDPPNTVPKLMPFVIEQIEQQKPIPPSVIHIAKNSGFDTAKYMGKWNNYDIYSPSFSDNITHYIGSPLYILFNEDELRWATIKENLVILKELKTN